MANLHLDRYYLRYLKANITYAFTSIKKYSIPESEAKLIDYVNIEHSDQIYGKELFQARKDNVVYMEDVLEYYAFIKFCHTKQLCNVTLEEKCGFIIINSKFVVPYIIKNNEKYIPLFFFEGKTDLYHLRHGAVKLENWNLEYLKFYCKIKIINNELYNSYSCIVTSLDYIKNCFPPETNYEDNWLTILIF